MIFQREAKKQPLQPFLTRSIALSLDGFDLMTAKRTDLKNITVAKPEHPNMQYMEDGLHNLYRLHFNAPGDGIGISTKIRPTMVNKENNFFLNLLLCLPNLLHRFNKLIIFIPGKIDFGLVAFE